MPKILGFESLLLSLLLVPNPMPPKPGVASAIDASLVISAGGLAVAAPKAEPAVFPNAVWPKAGEVALLNVPVEEPPKAEPPPKVEVPDAKPANPPPDVALAAGGLNDEVPKEGAPKEEDPKEDWPKALDAAG